MPPVRLAALLTLTYAGLAGGSVVLSDRLAASGATSTGVLAALERYQGVSFIAVTAVLLFFGAWWATHGARRGELELARARDLLLAAERQAMAGLFVSSLAHDANNMASIVLGTLDYVIVRPDLDPELKGFARDAREATEKLTQVFRDLKGLARTTARREELDVAEVARRDADLLLGHSALRDCTLAVTGPETLPWPVYGPMLDQVLVNLVMNAAEATHGQGRIELRLSVENEALLIEVHDDGPGLSEAQQATLFRPFVTTKPGGTGLGLVSVKECARAHWGEVSVSRSPVLGGACFRVRLPRQPPGLTSPPAPTAT